MQLAYKGEVRAVHRSALEPHVSRVEMHRPCENCTEEGDDVALLTVFSSDRQSTNAEEPGKASLEKSVVTVPAQGVPCYPSL